MSLPCDHASIQYSHLLSPHLSGSPWWLIGVNNQLSRYRSIYLSVCLSYLSIACVVFGTSNYTVYLLVIILFPDHLCTNFVKWSRVPLNQLCLRAFPFLWYMYPCSSQTRQPSLSAVCTVFTCSANKGYSYRPEFLVFSFGQTGKPLTFDLVCCMIIMFLVK